MAKPNNNSLNVLFNKKIESAGPRLEKRSLTGETTAQPATPATEDAATKTTPPAATPSAAAVDAIQVDTAVTTPATPTSDQDKSPGDTTPGPTAPSAAPTTPVPAPAGESSPLAAALARAEAARAAAGMPATTERVTMRTQSLYPPKGKSEAFREKARDMGVTNGALAMRAVLDHMSELEQLMGPESADLVPGYKPRSRGARDRNAISLRLTEHDYNQLVALQQAWPGCRSVNDLLSTAVDLLLP